MTSTTHKRKLATALKDRGLHVINPAMILSPLRRYIAIRPSGSGDSTKYLRCQLPSVYPNDKNQQRKKFDDIDLQKSTDENGEQLPTTTCK